MEARQLQEIQRRAQGSGTVADWEYSGALVRKWGSLAEGIRNPYTKRCFALLCENQVNHMRQLNEETLSTGVGSFTKYIFPILRRVFPNLIANEIVSVQPMTSPIGGIFTYEYKYDDAKGGAGISGGIQDKNLVETFNAYYSSEYIDYELVEAANGGDTTISGTLSWIPIHPLDADRGFSVIITTEIDTDAVVVQDDGNGGFTATTDPGGHFDSGTIDYDTGAVSLDLSGASGADNTADATATYYYNSEKVGFTDNAKVPSVSIDLALETIQAETRKLRSRWSVEAMDDLRAFHGLDIEAEIVAGLANQIALELDREIIDDLVNGATNSATYSHAADGWDASAVSSELESVRHLLTVMESVSAQIHKRTKRAPANFVVVPPEVAALLAQLTTNGDFVAAGPTGVVDPTYGSLTSNFGVTKLGSLRNKYVVYQDPYLDSNTILMGLKGQSFLDAGYVYAPYVPLQMTPTFLDPNSFDFRKGLRTRYGKKLLRGEFYGTITVSGLPTVTVS